LSTLALRSQTNQNLEEEDKNDEDDDGVDGDVDRV